MKNLLTGFGLFLLQIYLIFGGVRLFGVWINPFLLFGVSVAIGWFYFKAIQVPEKEAIPEEDTNDYAQMGWTLLGVAGVLSAFGALRHSLRHFSYPREFSDVLPQLETLYLRYADRVFPYGPVDMTGYSPYPVYMPLHWMPIGIPVSMGFDTRWIGYAALVVAIGLYSWQVARWSAAPAAKATALLLPGMAFWAFLLFGDLDLHVTLETLVGAYYLILAAGLISRNLTLTAIGLILCMLSRYTLVFWLPVMAWLLWRERPLRQNIAVWGSVAVAFIALYLVPFYLKDPTILKEGLAYHNHAAVDEWKGYGDPPVSGTFQAGIYFAPHLKAIFGGDMDTKVFWARVVQGSLMLALALGGILLYERKRRHFHWSDFSLLALYACIVCFYSFGPLTYRYYWIVPLLLSAVLCGRIFRRWTVDGRR